MGDGGGGGNLGDVELVCYDLSFALSFALLHADTSDCFLSSLPHPLIGLLYFYDPILLTRSHLVASCPVRYVSGVAI